MICFPAHIGEPNYKYFWRRVISNKKGAQQSAYMVGMFLVGKLNPLCSTSTPITPVSNRFPQKRSVIQVNGVSKIVL